MADNSRLSWPAEREEIGAHSRGRLLALARCLWAALALNALAVFLLSLPGYLAELQSIPPARGPLSPLAARAAAVSGAVTSLLAVVISLSLAGLLYWRRGYERVALLTSGLLLLYGAGWAGPVNRLAYLYPDAPLLADAVATYFKMGPLSLFLFVFPDGRFVPRWTRWLALLSVPLMLVYLPVILTREPGQVYAWHVLLPLVTGAFLLPLTGVSAQVYRYRRVSTGAERQQTRWVIFGLALWMSGVVLFSIPYVLVSARSGGAAAPWWMTLLSSLWLLWQNVLPLSLTVAVMRYRLWQIDPLVNRTLLYAALTTMVVAIYVLIVGGLGTLLQARSTLFTSLLATGIIALLFHPLRERLQRGINRLFYGERDDPATVFSRLGQRLERATAPEAVLPGLVETVATTLKLPYVAVGWEEEIAAAHGEPVAEPLQLPLVYQGEVVGVLLVGKRQGYAFNPAERSLLQAIAGQAGQAVHAVRLTADLRRSRQRLVSAREEERRRLRRDLHDGLGPTLAAHTLAAGSARALLSEDPRAADRLLRLLEEGLEATLDEIRHLVYNLRPPDLDQLGLAGAIEATAGRLRAEVAIELDVPDRLPALPAAVEVAAYRIVQEALTNVVRHAGAQQCRIRLRLEEDLLVSVADDGIGMGTATTAGVGLHAMRERAEELGGSLQIESAPGQGTTVRARLPLSSGQAEVSGGESQEKFP